MIIQERDNTPDQSGSGEGGKDGLFLDIFGNRDDKWDADCNRIQARLPDSWPKLLKVWSCHLLTCGGKGFAEVL